MAKKELTMAEKHFNYEVRELKLGASFTNNKASQYHTIKYDFKPASVDVTKMATVDVGLNNQVTVTVPHLDGAGVPQTVFKGNQRPYTKECVLIIDHDTGEITLEKLSSNIQVKKTRSEPLNKPRPLTPVISELTNTTQRSTSRTRVATNKRTSGNAGPSASASGAGNTSRFNGSSSSQKTPPNVVRSPPRMKTSPPQAAPWSGGNSTLASLPMIGLDLDVGPAGAAAGAQAQAAAPAPVPAPAPPAPPAGYEYGGSGAGAGVGAAYRAPDRHQLYAPAAAPAPDRHHASDAGHVSNMTAVKPEPAEPMQEDSSSSSSSDSGSDSDSASDSDNEAPAHHHHSHHQPHHAALALPAGNPPLPGDVLGDDLCLSGSGSDTD